MHQHKRPQQSTRIRDSLAVGRFTHGYAAAGVAVVVLQMIVPDGTYRAALSVLAYLASTAFMALGVRLHRPTHPLPWRALVLTTALVTVNLALWLLVEIGAAGDSAFMLMDGFKLAAIVALAVSVAGFVHVRRTTTRRDTLLDGTLIAGGGAMMLWQWYILIQARRAPGVQPDEMVPIILAGLMLTVGLTFYRVVGGTRNFSTAARYLVAASVFAVVGQGALILTDAGAGPARWTDFLWMLAPILAAAAALHPSMRILATNVNARQRLAPRLVIAGAALLANPLLVIIQLLDGTPARRTILIAGMAMGSVALLGLWKVGRLVVQLDAARTALARSERRFRSLVQRASEVVAVLDMTGRFSYVSPATKTLIGLPAKDLAGTNLIHLVVPPDREMFAGFWTDVCAAPTGEAMTIELGLLSGKDEPLRADIVAINLQDDADVSGIAVTIRDVTVRAAFEAKLRHLATHDSLTGLANRELFRDRVGTALQRAKRSGKSVGVVFIDLDDFKTINDSLGHLVGDELLQVVAARLIESLRAADTAARLGGDEFAILLEALSDEESAHRIVDRLQLALRRPVAIEGRPVHIGASMGLVIAGPDATPADLLRNADTAMFNAKNAGKDRTHVFEPSMHVAARSRFDMKADLHNALDRQEFEVYYQPVFRLSDRTIRGFEALLRWNHPRRGVVLPGEFIPLVEETGQIVPLGRWVMDTAVAQASAWARMYPQLGDFVMGVNLSVRQFQQESMVDDIAASLRAGQVDPDRIVIEITESVFIGDTEAAVARLEQLKNLGVQLAIDDFGTGYSALGYLQRFQADIVKVDKSFVAPLGRSRTDATLTNGILELVRGLGISTVAEGVERQDQVLDLIAMDCDLAQGFHLAIPRPAAGVERMLDSMLAGRAATA